MKTDKTKRLFFIFWIEEIKSWCLVGDGEFKPEYAADAQACFDKADELYQEIHGKPPPDAKTKFEECFHMEVPKENMWGLMALSTN